MLLHKKKRLLRESTDSSSNINGFQQLIFFCFSSLSLLGTTTGFQFNLRNAFLQYFYVVIGPCLLLLCGAPFSDKLITYFLLLFVTWYDVRVCVCCLIKEKKMYCKGSKNDKLYT